MTLLHTQPEPLRKECLQRRLRDIAARAIRKCIQDALLGRSPSQKNHLGFRHGLNETRKKKRTIDSQQVRIEHQDIGPELHGSLERFITAAHLFHNLNVLFRLQNALAGRAARILAIGNNNGYRHDFFICDVSSAW